MSKFNYLIKECHMCWMCIPIPKKNNFLHTFELSVFFDLSKEVIFCEGKNPKRNRKF